MPVSTIVVYNGTAEFLEPCILSVASQNVPCSDIVIADLTGDKALAETAASLPCESRVISRTADEDLVEFFHRVWGACYGEYRLILPVQHVLTPRYFEATLPELEQNSRVGAVLTHCRLFGVKQDIYVPTLVNALSFADLPCFPLYRASAVEECGGFGGTAVEYFYTDLLLRVANGGYEVALVDKPLMLCRELAKPTDADSLIEKRVVSSSDFLARHMDLLQANILEVMRNIEKVYELERVNAIKVLSTDVFEKLVMDKAALAAERNKYEAEKASMEAAVARANKEYAEKCDEYGALLKLHKESLSSVRTLVTHLVASVGRRLVMPKG